MKKFLLMEILSFKINRVDYFFQKNVYLIKIVQTAQSLYIEQYFNINQYIVMCCIFCYITI